MQLTVEKNQANFSTSLFISFYNKLNGFFVLISVEVVAVISEQDCYYRWIIIQLYRSTQFLVVGNFSLEFFFKTTLELKLFHDTSISLIHLHTECGTVTNVGSFLQYRAGTPALQRI